MVSWILGIIINGIIWKLAAEKNNFENDFLTRLFFLSLSDSLDLVMNWLQEAADDLEKLRSNRLPPHGSGDGAAGEASALCPTAVQNQAYLKLLKWDHMNRPFPEVGV